MLIRNDDRTSLTSFKMEAIADICSDITYLTILIQFELMGLTNIVNARAAAYSKSHSVINSNKVKKTTLLLS